MKKQGESMKMKWNLRSRSPLIITFTLLLFVTIALMFPIIWMVSGSFKGPNIFADAYSLIPVHPDYRAYLTWLGSSSQLWIGLRNTTFSFVATIMLTLPLGAMAGYALARWRTRWITFVLMLLFFLQMMPGFVTTGPLFRQFIEMKMIGNPLALYVVYTAFNLPLVIIVLRNYFLSLPTEIEEAATVDGCNRFQVFWKVTLPLAQPALITCTVFVFIGIWLEYLLANNLMRGKYQTLATLLINTGRSWGNDFHTDLMLSMGTLILIPLTLLFPLVRKYLVSGLSIGALKG
jgi:ABC-type glycerol-3-phosphate transport system permease component